MFRIIQDLTARVTGNRKRTVCPQCRGVEQFRLAGEGRSDRPQTKEVIKACDLCKGVGFLTADNKAWIELGKQLKEYRVRKGMTQSEFAHRYGGLRSAELEAMEKGYRDPTRFAAFLSQRGIDLKAG